ncbi:pyridoxal phosphate-dependent decarboxylase family protein [Flavisolibacter tropicus]|uniref:Amino acid decarboxylase n=1 Tax=Flavisolibacter tropicus TaxID=1492898 RepID=A0A172TQD6_9BACT|nr:pyridoxal-dependent decarboxylase [Flavisolibacter tropicus]ANE49192.1 amino acid decarboxylase [Flavisolibacter tropicus]
MTDSRRSPIEIDEVLFRTVGHQLVDTIAQFFDSIKERPVTSGELPKQLQEILGHSPLPEHGIPIEKLLTKVSTILLNHSLFNGHPKFLGYITSSPAPIGALADMLAATVNANVGAQILSPMATEIEKQTVSWLAEFIGVSPNYGGLLVSGGNMANFTGFLAGRTAKAPKRIKEEGLTGLSAPLVFYCSKATHTWAEKAAILFGLGANAIHWIETTADRKINTLVLEQTIKADKEKGYQPFLVVGNAGDVSTGVVDDFRAIADICKTYNLWFHIDGAYGIPAAAVPSQQGLFAGIEEADSLALDPHKWLYSPLEAGCTLVKDPNHLLETFSSHPVYYNFDNTEEEIPFQNFYEYGLQNSRGFRALKVWLALQQVGKSGYVQMIEEDISVSNYLFELASRHPELEAVTQNLSITALRYIPQGYNPSDDYLNNLNEALLNELQKGGQVFLSNALINDQYCLRSCVVNFRTSKKDMEEIIDIVVNEGRRVHAALRQK